MGIEQGERHDGDGIQLQATRHIQAKASQNRLGEVALIKMDFYDASTTSKRVATLWIDSARYLRGLLGEPTAAQKAGTTTAVGAVLSANPVA